MLSKREVILAKIESTYNTDPTPSTSSDEILVENLGWSFEGARMVDREAVRPSLGKLKQVWGDTLMQVTFDVELKGAGATYSASVRPEADVLFRACGLSSTVDTTTGSETVTYAPTSTSHESITIYYYADGKLFKLTGCRGNCSINLETGSKGMASFTFTGHTTTPTDVSLPTPSYNSAVPPAVINGTFTIDSYAATVNAVAMDVTNQIAMPPDLSASDGYGEVQITGRDVSGSIDPEAELVATEAFVANWRSNASMALATGDIGSTQYNKYNLTAPGVYYREVSQGDREGIRTYDLSCGFSETTTDNEFALVFD